MKIREKILIMTFVGLWSVGLSAQNVSPEKVPTLHIIATNTPPVIDGKLDDLCWRQSSAVSRFVNLDGYWSREQTTVWVTYDQKNIYVAYLCRDSALDKLQAQKKDRDDVTISRNDCVELYFDVNHNHQSFYHLMIDSLGNIYDATCDERKAIRDKSWNFNGTIATGKNQQGWTLELSIPFTSMGLTAAPKQQTTWGVNFNREQQALCDCSSWSMTNNFNDPIQFGNLVFGTAGQVSSSFSFSSDRQGEILTTAIRNTTGKSLDLAITSGLTDSSSSAAPAKTYRMVLKPNEEKSIDFKVDLERAEAGVDFEWGFKIVDLKTHEVYQNRKAFLVNRINADLTTDRYYYPDKIDAIQATVTTKVGNSVRIVLSRNLAGKPIAEKKCPIASGQQSYSFSFPTANLEAGRYIVSAEISRPGQKQNYVIRRVIFIKVSLAPPVLPEVVKNVSFRSDGVILVNQTPFCPFIATDPPSEKMPLSENSFNVKWSKVGLIPNAMNRPMLIAGHWIYQDTGGVISAMPQEDKIQEFLKNEVTRYKSDPRLFGWYLCYESQIPMYREGKLDAPLNNPAELTKMNRFVKSLDPSHPTFIQVDDLVQLPQYKDVVDILEVAAYSSSYASRLVPNLTYDVKRIRSILGKGKPFLFYIGSSIPHESKRTAEEIKCASYLALMHGANGLVFHTGHEGIKPTSTRHWSLYPGLAREIETMFPILIAPSASDLPKVMTTCGDLTMKIKKYQNDFYLIACNPTVKLLHPTFRLDKSCTMQLIFENRQIACRENAFSDDFLPFEVHVYKLNFQKR